MRSIVCRYVGYFEDETNTWGRPGTRCYLCGFFDVFKGRLHSVGGFREGGVIDYDKDGSVLWDVVISKKDWDIGKTGGNKIIKEKGWICILYDDWLQITDKKGDYWLLFIKNGVKDVLEALLDGKDN